MKGATARIGLIGYGFIAQKHIEVFRALGAEVVATCNRSEAKRREARERWGIAAGYSDPLEMADREQPDALLLTAGIEAVAPLARTLLPLHLPMLIEKPPGLSLEETRGLAALAREHGTPAMVGLNRRFYSVYHRALERMGGRGAVTGVNVEWSEDPPGLLAAGVPAEQIPLYVYANSLHGVDLLPFFAGAIPSPAVWGRDLDPAGGQYRWQMALDGVAERGARVHFASNWDVPGRWRLVVDAPDARMVSAPLETALILARGKGVEEVSPSDEDKRFKPGFHGQAAFFLEVVRDGRPVEWPACGLPEALPGMEICERLTRAVRDGAMDNVQPFKEEI
ncbi:MAG TPA: hypothetical protein DCS11_00215 [Syntrophus sp. (in: bacteria)]|nr:hypothetical protein [Syntrophus sp. (in: bacteria)]